jgi:hypothetical protein
LIGSSRTGLRSVWEVRSGQRAGKEPRDAAMDQLRWEERSSRRVVAEVR